MSASRPLLAACVLTALAARAEPPLTGLTWSAPEGCIQTGELAQRVEQRLGFTTFATLAPRHVHGQLQASEAKPRWRVKLTLVDSGGTVLGSRELSSHQPQCRALDESLVFVLAVMIDPQSAMRAPVPQAQEPAEVAPPVSDPPAPPVTPRAPVTLLPPSQRLRLEGGRYLLNGGELTSPAFYGLVGREDLREAAASRGRLKVAGFTVGGMAAGAGGVLFLAQALGVGCVRYAGTPEQPGGCVEGGPELRTAGLISLAAGAALIVGAAILSERPTTPQEDSALVDAFNAREREAAGHRM